MVNMDMIMLYIGIMIIIHAIVSSLIMKVVDGGTPYAAFFDIVVMIWLGAAISWFLPLITAKLLPGFNELVSAETADAVDAAVPAG
jgi:archaellum biogenesis protein FlaJ (TadC family)